MTVSRWLVALACLALLVIPAQAQNTTQDFSGTGGTPYTEYGQGTAGFVNNGPPGPANYYQLCASGVGSTDWCIAFDRTLTGPATHITIDFDFSVGGTAGAGNYADGFGVALIPTSVYGTTGNGPILAAEGPRSPQTKDGSISIGIDTYDNGLGDDDSSGFDIDNNTLKLQYADTNSITNTQISLNGFGYQCHQDTQSTRFDHMTITVAIDPNGAGATVTVQITSNQVGNTGDPPGNRPSPANRGGPGTSVAAGTTFTPLSNVLLPGVLPYEMRLCFGARTGGATDNEAIANVNCLFAP
jgi:hypothetical protein